MLFCIPGLVILLLNYLLQQNSMKALNSLIPILFLPLSPELVLSAFCPTILSRERRVKVITTSMLLNPLALQQYSPSLTSDTVDCCILRNTFAFLVWDTILSWLCPTFLTTLLSPLLLPIPHPPASGLGFHLLLCLSSCGFKYHHKLTVFTITSLPEPQNQISTISWNLHLTT